MSLTRKSQSDEFFIDLFRKLLIDISHRRPELKRTLTRDIRTLEERVAHEGIQFLTKTLPKLGKAIDRALGEGRFEAPKEFKRSHENPAIPAFMQGMLNRLFDHSGCLVDTCPTLVRDIRQVVFFAYKLETPYSLVQEAATVAAFVHTEEELGLVSIDSDSALVSGARLLVERVLHRFDSKGGTPRHGPGAVATGEKLDEKWTFKRLYSSIHQRFPYYDYFVVGKGREILDRVTWYRSLERLHTGCAKVCLVPKDSRGPRLISCEPLEYQWIQQMIGRTLVSHLERHSLTKGHINFTDQSVNQQLALASSRDEAFATLDMKDASDRVSCELVKALFPNRVFDDLMAARTTSTMLPDGTILPLKKFAPMGSALCFPVEALCFWALCMSALRILSGLPEGLATRFFGGRVYVYGDDIILPTLYASRVMEMLETVGLKFNRDKCFTSGPFRESCGMDAYKGYRVTPNRLRSMWTGKRSDGKSFASYCALANSLADCYPGSANLLWENLERVYGKIPYTSPGSAFPGKEVSSRFKALILNLENGMETRYVDSLQSVEIKALYLRAKDEASTVDGWSRALRNLTSGAPVTSRVALPNSAQIKRGWRRFV